MRKFQNRFATVLVMMMQFWKRATMKLPTPDDVAVLALNAKSPELAAAEAELAAMEKRRAAASEDLAASADLANPAITRPGSTDGARAAAAERAERLRQELPRLAAGAQNIRDRIEALRPMHIAAVSAAVLEARLNTADELVRLCDAITVAVDSLNATSSALIAAGASVKRCPPPPYLNATKTIAQSIAAEARVRARS